MINLEYEFYVLMLDLIPSLLKDVYRKCQKNGKIPSAVSRGTVALLRKNSNSQDNRGNFRLITLLKTEFNILAKVLVKRLALVVGGIIVKAQTCTIPSSSI